MASRLAAGGISWFNEIGVTPLAPQTALQALDAIVTDGSTAVTVLDCDWAIATSRFGSDLISELGGGAQRGDAGSCFGNVRARLKELGPEQRADLLLRECRRVVEEILKDKVGDENLDSTLVDLGLDSMAALRLRYGVNDELGVDIPLTHLLGELSIVSLADRLAEAWRIGTESGSSSHGRPATAGLTEIEL